jgi:hypothetical protein
VVKNQTHVEVLNEQSLRKEVGSVALRLRHLAKKGLLLGVKHQVAIATATDIMSNLTRPPKGRRYSKKTAALAAVLRSYLGQSTYNLVANNLGLPAERNMRKAIHVEGTYNASLTDEDFEYIAKLYKRHMEAVGVPLGSVACMLGEDETGVNPIVGYDQEQDAVLGLCGKLCKARCTHIKPCREKCPDPHECAPNGAYKVPMDGTYAEVKEAVEGSRVSTLARAIVINPLHEKLGRVVLLWSATCKTFTTKDYILPQWALIHRLWEKHLAKVIGPLIGHSSDGDPTRRLAFLLYMRAEGDNQLKLDIDGFLFNGSPVTHKMSVLCDMDFIHNVKKLINPLNSPVRALRLGDNGLSLGALKPFFDAVSSLVHGARLTDLNRSGYRAMDFPSV